MTSFNRPLRLGALAGASVLALALAAPVMANDLAPRTGSTTTVPQTPDVGGGYRPDPTRKTVGEMERDIAEGKYDRSTAPERTGDQNKIGETQTQQPVQPGTQTPTGGAYRASGAATTPGVPPNENTGSMGANRGAMSDGTYQGGMSGQRGMSGQTGATNLEVGSVNINELPPNLQQAVRSRMGPQQKPNELVETTILNRLALMGSEYRVNNARKVGADYVIVVVNPDGRESTMLYETASGDLREVQM